MRRFMRFFYFLLYHPFAFTYDLVAWIVSFGQWKDWVFSVFPYIEGTRILELGHGPGHLQRFLRDRGLDPAGLDESTQMGNLASRRLGANHKLARGLAQSLPFDKDSFDTVVSTFPSEYIFDLSTLKEIHRVLANPGKLVVLPAAFPSNGFLKWLYKVTRETPESLNEALMKRMAEPFSRSGFQVEVKTMELNSSTLVMVIGEKA